MTLDIYQNGVEITENTETGFKANDAKEATMDRSQKNWYLPLCKGGDAQKATHV